MAVEAVALDPEASMNPYGDSRLWNASPKPEQPSVALHPFGDPAFWIEGLAEAAPGEVTVSGPAGAPSAVADAASDHASGPAGPDSLEAPVEGTEAVLDLLALPGARLAAGARASARSS